MLSDDDKSELDKLKGKDRLEKAVALHIHAINTPLMVAEGYLPDKDSDGVDEKGIAKIRRSIEKLKAFSLILKGELKKYRSTKDSD